MDAADHCAAADHCDGGAARDRSTSMATPIEEEDRGGEEEAEPLDVGRLSPLHALLSSSASERRSRCSRDNGDDRRPRDFDDGPRPTTTKTPTETTPTSADTGEIFEQQPGRGEATERGDRRTSTASGYECSSQSSATNAAGRAGVNLVTAVNPTGWGASLSATSTRACVDAHYSAWRRSASLRGSHSRSDLEVELLVRRPSPELHRPQPRCSIYGTAVCAHRASTHRDVGVELAALAETLRHVRRHDCDSDHPVNDPPSTRGPTSTSSLPSMRSPQPSAPVPDASTVASVTSPNSIVRPAASTSVSSDVMPSTARRCARFADPALAWPAPSAPSAISAPSRPFRVPEPSSTAAVVDAVVVNAAGPPRPPPAAGHHRSGHQSRQYRLGPLSPTGHIGPTGSGDRSWPARYAAEAAVRANSGECDEPPTTGS
ncbi:hypothetical protein FQA39_LY19208 [Lamprigera yunnana]|nr:hypothetical protein FQA39_LY19208 [Lamprigera yunnana]